MAAATTHLTPLPNIEGPKLDPFTQNIDNHNFVMHEFLGSGVHSAVLRVAIDHIPYVIKVFKPEWTREPCFDMFPLAEEYIKDRPFNANANHTHPPAVMDDLRGQATSFNAECRVYGRLKELGKEDLAVKAHGYLRLFVTPEFQQQWEMAVALRYPGDELLKAMYRNAARVLEIDDSPNQPVYAIVKDYVQDHRNNYRNATEEREMKQRQIKHIPQMLRHLHQLHKCGIVVRDLKDQQYYEGQIADFSHAWTVPHITGPENDLRPAWAWKSMAAWDLHCFQEYIINRWNQIARNNHPRLRPTRTVAWRNGDNEYNLRSRRREQFGPDLPLCKYDLEAHFDMRYDPPFDPSEFNWRGLEQTKREKGIITGRVKKREGRTGPRRRRGRRAAQANGGQADGGQADADEADPGDVLM